MRDAFDILIIKVKHIFMCYLIIRINIELLLV